MSSKLSIVAIAVHRDSDELHFLGASSDFSKTHFVILDNELISADPVNLALRDVHTQTPVSNDGTRCRMPLAGRMSLNVESENHGSKWEGTWLQLQPWTSLQE